jgi:transposase
VFTCKHKLYKVIGIPVYKMKITTKEVRGITEIIDDIIEEYKEESEPKKRDWRTYEQRVARRLKTAFKELKPLVHEAVSSIKIIKGETKGSKSILTLEQKVLALLLKHLIGKSNREMSFMLIIFSWLTDVDVSYKTIERLYSDQEVLLALHNLHILMLKKKGIKEADCGGDGTGYGLTVKKHYASEAQKLKDKIKENKVQKKKSKEHKKTQFIFSFTLIDIETRMYIAYGSSFKSEKEAFLDAVVMLRNVDVNINSLRLDRYYQQAYVKLLEKELGKVKFYIIPKKNATIRGSWEWKRMLSRFVEDTKTFLQEYFQRNQSESGIAEDKKRTGWRLGQKREDRIDTANILTGLWHNLYWLAD